METSLTAYRAEFQDRLLDLLWRQWNALGVAGQGGGAPWLRTPLDPEALLLVSCTVARHDPRLFDAMLDWLRVNGRFVNVQRLRRMLTAFPFAGDAVFAAVAATTSTSAQAMKWAQSAKGRPNHKREAGESLFRMADGQALPVLHEPDPVFLAHGLLREHYQQRGVAMPFRPEITANLLLRLRAFLGVSARCEILTYLVLNRQGSPRAVAQACGYYPATVTRALAEMGGSGYVVSRVEGRHRHYTLALDAWRSLLLGEGDAPRWIAWPALFSALEQVWLFFQQPESAGQSPLAQASALRRILRAGVLDALADSGLPVVFGDDQRHVGESLIPFFVARMREVFDRVQELG